MPTTVIKTIGTSSRDYSTLQAWEDAASVDLTQTRSNNCLGGSTSTILLDAGASAVDGQYVGNTVTNSTGEERLCTAYVGATKLATIGVLNGSSATWTTPLTGTAFTINSVIWQGQAYNDSEFTTVGGTGSFVVIGGSTSSATCYKELTVAAGQSLQDAVGVPLAYNVSNGVGCRSASLSDYPIRLTENYSRFSRFQIQVQGPYARGGLKLDGGVLGTIVKDCLFDILTTASNVTIVIANASVGPFPIFENLAIFIRGSSGPGIGLGRGTAIACTVVRTSDQSAAGIGIAGSPYVEQSAIIQSCAVFGFTTAFSGSNFILASCGNNVTEQASGAPGSGNRYNVAFNGSTLFKQAAVSGYDLRPIPGPTPLIDGGILNTSIPNDIFGTPRLGFPTAGACEPLPTVLKLEWHNVEEH